MKPSRLSWAVRATGVWGLLILAACADQTEPPRPVEHVALHGGTLVHFDNHQRHLELVLDRKTGQVTLYLLGQDARHPIAAQESELALRIQMAGLPGDEDYDYTITLQRQNEPPVYVGQSVLLEHALNFTATLEAVTIGPQRFERLVIAYPRGNEY